MRPSGRRPLEDEVVMAQPEVEIGARAVRLLMSRIDKPTQPYRTLRLAPSLVVRSSCGCHPDDV